MNLKQIEEKNKIYVERFKNNLKKKLDEIIKILSSFNLLIFQLNG